MPHRLWTLLQGLMCTNPSARLLEIRSLPSYGEQHMAPATGSTCNHEDAV
jgi:hypothetical protein